MAALERVAALQSIDDRWREHLRGMDDLKEGIYLRAYGQKDPLLEYKQEAYKIFIELVKDINKDTVHFAFKYYPRIVERQPAPEAQAPAIAAPAAAPAATESGAPAATAAAVPQLRTSSASRPLSFSHPTATSSYGAAPSSESSTSATVRNAEMKVGRNEPCPCGSGKKFKACHGMGGSTTFNG